MNRTAFRTGAAAILAVALFPVLGGSASGASTAATLAAPAASAGAAGCDGTLTYDHSSFGSVFEQVHQRGRSPRASVALTYGMEADLQLCETEDDYRLTGLQISGYGFAGAEAGVRSIEIDRVALIDGSGNEVAVSDDVWDSETTGRNFVRGYTESVETELALDVQFAVSVHYRVHWADDTTTEVSRTSPFDIPMNTD